MSIYKFLKHPDVRINNLLKKIIRLHPEEINLSLDRIKRLLKDDDYEVKSGDI